MPTTSSDRPTTRTVATVRKHSRNVWRVTPNYDLVRTPSMQPYYFPTWKRATTWADHIGQMAGTRARVPNLVALLGRAPIATPQDAYSTPTACILGRAFVEPLTAAFKPLVPTPNPVRAAHELAGPSEASDA